MKTFVPNRQLALTAVLLEATILGRAPIKTKLSLFGLFSGLCLAINLMRLTFHRDVTAVQWIGSFLATPLFLLIGFIGQYGMYRFARTVSISEDGYLSCGFGRILRFWKPVECRIDRLRNAEGIYLFRILCINPTNPKPHPIYSGLTDDPASAIDFIAEFNKKIRKS